MGGGVMSRSGWREGKVWRELGDSELGHLMYGGSIFLGADTVVGPLYLGLGWNSESEVAILFAIEPGPADGAASAVIAGRHAPGNISSDDPKLP